MATGRYAPGERMPGVREMAAEAGVNPNTMQRALTELESRGLLFTQRTSGRFVTQDAEQLAQLRGRLALGLARDYVRGMRGLGSSEDEIERYVKLAKEEDA